MTGINVRRVAGLARSQTFPFTKRRAFGGYFEREYSLEIWENGIQCRDLVVFERMLRAAPRAMCAREVDRMTVPKSPTVNQ